MDYEPRDIEESWRNRWEETGRYEAEPSGDEKEFVTVPYPYPSGGMHIGHARTYTVPDAYARFRRLCGETVLFPIAWHVTGTPIVGAVERLLSGDEEQLSVLRDTFQVPESQLKDLETPMGFAEYFIENHYKKGMQQLGLSIDWRREFTTNDERYSKFISWQYETLFDRGLLEQGMHPVKFCTNEEQPVTTHDLLEGEESEFQEYTLIKFEFDEVIVPMATLRPETVRGVTNAFIDPDAEYVYATVDDETWFVSRTAAEKFGLQGHSVNVEESVRGTELVGERVENPVTGETVLVLPAAFVDADNATGVVMSVPGHSPDDWVALMEIKDDPSRVVDYGIDSEDIEEIEPRGILQIEGYGEFPAGDIVAEYGISSQEDPQLEEATQELYNQEFHQGTLNEEYGEFAGEVIEDVRDRYRAHYQSKGVFGSMHEFTDDVVCRCGGAVEVATQETWFLRYNDGEWKGKTHDAADRIDAIPENTRSEYHHTIDWLNEWPCIRNYGLGTRLPWDEEFVIEPLSDSTIYMAYYTIAHRLQDIPVDALDRDFFDALFYGPDAVSDPDERALELREEWQYWYPVDYRCSANDLISNHLTFFLFHHAELFEPSEWPAGITIMGMGLLEGEKMSSSKGHVVLPDEAIETYGADTVRFFLLNSAEPWQDYDWRSGELRSTRNQLERFWDRAQDVISGGDGAEELMRIDRWLLSKLQHAIREATEALEQFETRTASQVVFYDLAEDIRWYNRRADLDRAGARWTLREVLRARLVMLEPFIPFLSNELFEQLTERPAEDAEWPTVATEYEDPQVEFEEEIIRDLVADVREVIDVTGEDPDTIVVFTAAAWKQEVLAAVVDHGPDVGAVMSAVMEDESLRERGNEVNELVQTLVEYVREYPEDDEQVLVDVDEGDAYRDAVGFLETEFDATVDVVPEEDSHQEKAGDAVPFRPALLLD